MDINIFLKKRIAMPGVDYACNPSTLEAKAGGSPEVRGFKTSLTNMEKPHLY